MTEQKGSRCKLKTQLQYVLPSMEYEGVVQLDPVFLQIWQHMQFRQGHKVPEGRWLLQSGGPSRVPPLPREIWKPVEGCSGSQRITNIAQSTVVIGVFAQCAAAYLMFQLQIFYRTGVRRPRYVRSKRSYVEIRQISWFQTQRTPLPICAIAMKILSGHGSISCACVRYCCYTITTNPANELQHKRHLSS